ncbi:MULTISPECIES: TetR/AcrR family transcriptional regulator [unclassified Mesorhizobium]|uniref:TetR/AcrR family transcriptional regulator n=1 Tax=unclassified Mesorhizobium TaxID=325217 RepID=UPI00112DDC93|nr:MULTISPECIES: TetR/AcrR family transcriptional regulator [unclassified Mesorhizobium]MBZ9703963.1 TetR/AcrR family transcriptional regulator [Mesorhizobium sp. CO1-1-3]MBZ9950726.1 TetR/AcrR family transcriptional regulator [Mesorhizobium sp. BR1-1-11]MBZ9984181.1 TetR/AcrR family transcriptional regulator [Mesorhizobium sp. BR-1-1-8]TPI95658.1 TetR/AcrR family transcriptional regulator [Mesorhizobium sp. B2-8-1]TPL12704.1 TetR/AcrR family transcriptional regulator [Mesorhizobium sp. B2-4-1
MKAQRTNSRERILAAAADVARESGPGSLSLDAVASRAGVSKGGLLYNFPTKAKLMQGLVEGYLREFEQALETASSNDNGANPLAVYIRLSAKDCEDKQPSASWIFSAIAEDPDFMSPIKTFKRQLFQRLKSETPDLKSLLVCYLAIEGLRSMNLFDADVLSPDERQLLVSSLLEIAGSPNVGPARAKRP